MTDPQPRATRPRPWRSTEFAAGAILLLMAAFLYWFGRPLAVGTAFRMGPGYVPQLLSWGIAAIGVLLCAIGFGAGATALERWPGKPIVLVLGAMVAFAYSIEGAGLLIASLVAVLLGGLAAPDVRLRGLLVLAVSLAAFACVLFPLALQLPLKVLP